MRSVSPPTARTPASAPLAWRQAAQPPPPPVDHLDPWPVAPAGYATYTDRSARVTAGVHRAPVTAGRGSYVPPD
jgi:hypothetical protein